MWPVSLYSAADDQHRIRNRKKASFLAARYNLITIKTQLLMVRRAHQNRSKLNFSGNQNNDEELFVLFFHHKYCAIGQANDFFRHVPHE